MDCIAYPSTATGPALFACREGWDALRPQWQRLWEESGAPVFSSPAWLEAWWREFGQGDIRQGLLLFALRHGRAIPLRGSPGPGGSGIEGERLVGVVPLMQADEREGRLSLAGSPDVCDYATMVIAPGAEKEALEALLAALAEEGWQELALWGLPSDWPHLDCLRELGPARGYDVQVEMEAVCPRITLTPTWSSYLASLPKAERHELRRKLRRIAKEGGRLHFYHVDTASEVAEALPVFLHQLAESQEAKARFLNEAMARFFSRMAVALAEQGLLRLYFLELEGVRVASLMAFARGDAIYLYNSGYDPRFSPLAVGLVSKAMCVQQAIDEGRRFLDFLRGDERYKYELGAKDREVYRCLLSFPTRPGLRLSPRRGRP